MATINVRRLDDDVVQRLKKRASDNKRSLEGEVRYILEQVVNNGDQLKRESFRALAADLRQVTKGSTQTSSEDLIREDPDPGHRIV